MIEWIHDIAVFGFGAFVATCWWTGALEEMNGRYHRLLNPSAWDSAGDPLPKKRCVVIPFP